MIEQRSKFPHPFPVSADSLGTGLPEGWQDLPVDEQVGGLRENRIFARPAAFAAISLELAAKRMDCRDEELGKTALHLATLTEQWHAERTAQAYDAGMTETRKGEFSGNGRGGFVGNRIIKVFGADVINPRIWGDILGYNRMRAVISAGKAALLTEGAFNAMKHERWSDELVALAGLQYLRQSASGAIKDIAGRMLCRDAAELPRTKDEPDAIELFWSSKMAGSKNSLGIAYFLGYRDKLTPILKGEMQRQWGDDYVDNRQTFTVALNVHAYAAGDKVQKYAQTEIRRPAYALIRDGYFKEARKLMAEQAATENGKRVFSPISLHYLLGDTRQR